MENLALLVPYMIMVANLGLLGGMLAYGAYCLLSRSCVNTISSTKLVTQ